MDLPFIHRPLSPSTSSPPSPPHPSLARLFALTLQSDRATGRDAKKFYVNDRPTGRGAKTFYVNDRPTGRGAVTFYINNNSDPDIYEVLHLLLLPVRRTADSLYVYSIQYKS